MNTRDEIFKRLAGAFISDERANALIDAFAHELAEKVRARRHQHHDHIECVPCFMYGECADLIDPMKEGDRG